MTEIVYTLRLDQAKKTTHKCKDRYLLIAAGFQGLHQMAGPLKRPRSICDQDK